MAEYKEGRKYQETKELDIKDVAKLIRADLKTEFDGRDYKFSVRIKRYSMGQSIDIDASNTNIDRSTHTYSDVRDHIWRVAEQYGYDESDSQSDYRRVRFYTHVRILS